MKIQVTHSVKCSHFLCEMSPFVPVLRATTADTAVGLKQKGHLLKGHRNGTIDSHSLVASSKCDKGHLHCCL